MVIGRRAPTNQKPNIVPGVLGETLGSNALHACQYAFQQCHDVEKWENLRVRVVCIVHECASERVKGSSAGSIPLRGVHCNFREARISESGCRRLQELPLSHFKFSTMAELATSYAALILTDDNVEITVKYRS